MRVQIPFIAIGSTLVALCSPLSSSSAETEEFEVIPSQGVEIQTRFAGTCDEGEKAILLVNGGPGLSFNHLKILEHHLATDQVCVVMYNQRGMGDSKIPKEAPNTLRDNASDLKSVVDFLEQNRKFSEIHLFCHSFAGLVCLEYARLEPGISSRIDSMLLLGSKSFTSKGDAITSETKKARAEKLTKQGIIDSQQIQEAAKAGNMAEAIRLNWPLFYGDPKKFDRKAHPEFEEVEFNSDVFASVSKSLMAETTIGYDFTKTLAGLVKSGLDVAVLYGKSDMCFNEETERVIKQTGVHTFLIEKCGHNPWEECPAEFASTILPWMKAEGLPPLIP